MAESGKLFRVITMTITVVSVVTLFWPTLEWIANAWQHSPLDRQEPIFVLLAVLVWRMDPSGTTACSRRWGRAMMILGLAVLVHLFALLADIHFLSALALITALFSFVFYHSSHWLISLSLISLLFMALPSTSFLLGALFEKIASGGYALGEVIKWPLTVFFLAVILDCQAWKRYLTLVLLAPCLAALCVNTFGTAGRVQFAWFGSSPLAAIMAATLSTGLGVGIWYWGRLWQKQKSIKKSG